MSSNIEKKLIKLGNKLLKALIDELLPKSKEKKRNGKRKKMSNLDRSNNHSS